MTYATPGRLAKEFGLSPPEMYKVLVDLRLPVRAMGARLSPSQETKLRIYLRNVRTDRQRRHNEAVARTVPTSKRTPVMYEFAKTCGCCDRRWIFRSETDEGKPLCPDCVDHVIIANEPPTRTIARLQSHADLYHKEAERGRELVREKNQEKEAAYASRLKWMRAMAEVVLDHEEQANGTCWCGDQLPCRTWRTLESANRGIHRQVEKWASWKEDTLEEFLYGSDRRDREFMADEWLRSRGEGQSSADTA